MKHTFINDNAGCAWLRSTHLKGIAVPAPWHEFKSFVLMGNEDAPEEVNLYLSRDPLYIHDFFVVDFLHPDESGVYAGETRVLVAQP